MTPGRFKSRDDYFTKRSDLARTIIEKKPQKKHKGASESSIPADIMIDVFCRTVDTFEIEGEGRFERTEISLDEAVAQHCAGDITVRVNPLSKSGKTSWSVVKFILSDQLDHPFTKAKQFAGELQGKNIPSLIEVTEGGKGEYHLWIFYTEPVDGRSAAHALGTFGRNIFGFGLDTAPAESGDVFVALPLQGESLLFQRRVFVNAVGKMIKDQPAALLNIERTPRETFDAFIKEMSGTAGITPAAVKQTVPETRIEKKSPAQEIIAEKTVKPEIIAVPAEKEKPREREKPAPAPKTAVTRPSFPQTGTMKILMFQAGKESYGIAADELDSITDSSGISPVSSETAYPGGISHITDKNLPVFDMGVLLGSGKLAITPQSRILVLKGANTRTGLLVSSVSRFLSATVSENAQSSGKEPILGHAVEIDGGTEPLYCVNTKYFSDIAAGTAEKADTRESRDDRRYVIAVVDDVYYGFPADTVKEILHSSLLPGMQGTDKLPANVLRYGETVIHLVDIAKKPGSRAAKRPREPLKERIIVLTGKNRITGTRVDSVIGIRVLPHGTITSATEQPPVAGYAPLQDTNRIVMVVDTEKIV
ncbi:chemotaxis protein CheW [bacterium]|nr:chemotaxis protein CheW [bacterium]